MNERIYLLTGAAGLLGSNVSRKLIDRGEKVRALVLKNDPATKYIPEEAEIVIGDVTDVRSLEKFFTVPENTDIYVIHSASIVTLNPKPNKKVYNVNVIGTQNIINKCVSHKVKKLVYISSTGAIPEREGNLPIKEVDNFYSKDLVGYYSVTKAEASQLVLNALEMVPELDASLVHPSGICGPNDYSFGPVADFIIQYTSGKMPAGIEGTFNSVDVRDLADGVIECCEKGKRGESYIMSNSIVSMKDMFCIINEAAGLNYKPKILSPNVAKVLVKVMKVGSKITGKESQLSDFAIYNLTRNNNFDCSKAIKELGFKCRPFEETIYDEVYWLKEEYRI
nr:NAD-dependent epimerase/dehydratase family protein [Sedimentibacter sp.]